jgi:hypothetical protein
VRNRALERMRMQALSLTTSAIVMRRRREAGTASGRAERTPAVGRQDGGKGRRWQPRSGCEFIGAQCNGRTRMRMLAVHLSAARPLFLLRPAAAHAPPRFGRTALGRKLGTRRGTARKTTGAVQPEHHMYNMN